MANEQAKGFYVSEFRYENGMDYDSAVLAVPKNTATNCLNVFTIQVNGQGDNSMFPANGNVLSFSLPTISTQNKVYQFSISEPTGLVYSVEFLNINYSVIAFSTITMTGNISTDATNFQNTIIANLSAYTVSISHTISGSTATFTISITNIIGFDWLMQDTNDINTQLTNPVVTQEAIDRSVTDWNGGRLLPIGGIDYLGDLFIISTCQGNIPQTFNVVGAVSSGGKIEIKIAGNQTALFVAGESVNVQGVGGTVEANGVWSVVSSTFSGGDTNIILFSTTFSNAYTSGGTISIYNEGFLNISVHQKNLSSGVWTNTSLLSTKAVNERFYNPIRKEIVANKNNNLLSIYFVNGSDYDRVFSYTGAYISNGAIEFYNPLGQYTYDSVGLTTRNLKGVPTSIVQPIAYTDTGGAVFSGNWRYTVIPLDANLTPGQISLLSNPVNVYNGNTSQPQYIVGTPGVASSMTITVQVSEIPENVWSYFDLIGINYIGETETAYLIKRVPIPSNTTTLNIVHTGLEVATAYTAGFDYPSLAYISSGTQTTCGNTLLKGDLTAAQIGDFSTFAQLWTHVLNVSNSLLKPTGGNSDGEFGTITLGEYQIPIATAQNISAMLNETERVGIMPETTSGAFLPPFWVDDIRFDLNPTNVATPIANSQGILNRRTANNITSYDLSPSCSTTTTQSLSSNVFYATLSPPTGWQNYLIDGQPISSFIKRFHIVRVDNTTEGLNEVLSCGLINRHVAGTANGQDQATNAVTMYGSPGSGASNYLFDNPFLAASFYFSGASIPFVNAQLNTYITLFPNSPPNYFYGEWNSIWAHGGSDSIITANTPYSGSFYSPDWIYGQVSIDYKGGDTILCYGQPDWNTGTGTGNNMYCDSYETIPGVAQTSYGTFIELSGSTHITTDAYTNSWNVGLQQALPMGDFAGAVNSTSPLGLVYCSGMVFNDPTTTYVATWDTPSKIWIYTNNALTNGVHTGFQNPDIGLYYAQYYRNLGSYNAAANAANYPNNTKFGAIDTGNYIPTGAYIDVTQENNSVDVFGWDTFTQKCYIKIRYPNQLNGVNADTLGSGGTVMFFCQNRMNYNMRSKDILTYPATPAIDGWINYPSELPTNPVVATNPYDEGYTPRDPDISIAVYDPALPYPFYFPDLIIYSLVQPPGTTSNNWDIFPPLNQYGNLNSAYGVLTNITTLEDELVTIQQKVTLRQFYNEVGNLNIDEPSGSTEVTLGSGAPFSKPGEPIVNNRGNSNNLGLCKGVGINGEDIIAWIDILSQEFIVASRGGGIIKSLPAKMRSFFKNNLALVQADTPLRTPSNPYLPSIVSVWDDKRKQFVFTVWGVSGTSYTTGTSYSFGQQVQYGVVGFSQQIPQLYISLVNANEGNIPGSLSINDAGNDYTGFNIGDSITDTTNTKFLGNVLAINSTTGTLTLINNTGNNISSPTDALTNGVVTVNLMAATGSNTQAYWYGVPYSDQTSTADNGVNKSVISMSLIGESPNFIVNDIAVDSAGNTGTVIQTNGTTNLVLSGIKMKTGSFTGTITGSLSMASATVSESIPLGQNYNYYTIVYSIIPETNEKGQQVTGGRFITFLSPRPYFYVEFLNTYLTAHPSLSINSLYEDNISGLLCEWYNGGLIVNGLITFPTNDMPEVSKGWYGQWYAALNIPYYIGYETLLCASNTPGTQEDWQNENGDNFYNSIFNDTITAPNGTPMEDSTFLYGAWLLTTVTFLANTAQSIFKIITKFAPLNRTPNN